MKRPMLKVHRGGKPKKLPSEGPHKKREAASETPTFSLGLVEPGKGNPFVVLDSLGGDPTNSVQLWPPTCCKGFIELTGAYVHTETCERDPEPRLHEFLDTFNMGARVSHPLCPECEKAKK